MKTINLTLTGLTISEVLKTLHDNELTPTYMGIDQNFNLLYKVSYATEKDDIIKKALKYIDDYEKMGQDFELAIDTSFSKAIEALPVEAKTFIKKPLKYMAIKSIEKSLNKMEHERAENKH